MFVRGLKRDRAVERQNSHNTIVKTILYRVTVTYFGAEFARRSAERRSPPAGFAGNLTTCYMQCFFILWQGITKDCDSRGQSYYTP